MVERLKVALERAGLQRADMSSAQPSRTMSDGRGDLRPVPLNSAWDSIAERSFDLERLAQARITAMARRSDANAVFDGLRIEMHRFCKQKDWRRIALTAPTRSCGTTTFALNLAFAFARNTQARVMLVDFHIAAPAIAGRLGLAGGVSLQDVLSQMKPVDQILHRFGPGLIIAASAASRRGADRSPSDAQCAALIEQLHSTYQPDLLFLDMPPVLEDENTVLLLELTDAALLVASAEATTAMELEDSINRIEHATAYLGTALNKSRDRSGRKVHREFA